jgi:hypothetical protein
MKWHKDEVNESGTTSTGVGRWWEYMSDMRAAAPGGACRVTRSQNTAMRREKRDSARMEAERTY